MKQAATMEADEAVEADRPLDARAPFAESASVHADSPESRRNLELVQTGYQAFAKGDIATFLDLLDEDIMWLNRAIPGIPIDGAYRGYVGVVEFFKKVAATLEMQDFVVDQMFAGGDSVVVMGRTRSNIYATGRILNNTWVHVMTVRDGKITSYESYNDVAALAEGFGLQLPGDAGES